MLLCLLLFLFALCKSRKYRYHKCRLKFCRKHTALVKIRTSKNSVIHMDVFSYDKLPDKAASQRRAECTIDPSTMAFLNVFFNILAITDNQICIFYHQLFAFLPIPTHRL
jgi:hypothetical protein